MRRKGDLNSLCANRPGLKCKSVRTRRSELNAALARWRGGNFAALDLGGNPYGNTGRRHGPGCERHGSQHGVFTDAGSGEHRSVVGDAGARSQLGLLIGDIRLHIDVVGVRINVGIVRDAGPLVQDDLAAIVKQNILVDGAVVADGEGVAVGELDVVEDLDVLAQMAKDVATQHAAKAEPQPVIESNRRAVEHLPEPDERLAKRIFFWIDVAVILRLEGCVTRVEALNQGVHGEFAVEGRIAADAVRMTEVELKELIANDLGAAVRRLVAGEFFVEFGRPAAEKGSGFGGRVAVAILVDRHWLLLFQTRCRQDYSIAKTA